MLKRGQGRGRFLRLEHLEDRLAPAVITVNDPGAEYVNPYGTTVPGSHREIAHYFIVQPAAQREVRLDPLTFTNGPSATFKSVLEGGYGNPWHFTYAGQSPAGVGHSVKTYYALANSQIGYTNTYGPMAGGTLDVATTYTPPAGQTGHWLQVVTTNSPPGGGLVSPSVSYLDGDPADPDSPFYLDYDQRGYLDASGRENVGQDVTWSAELYFAVKTGDNAVTVYPDGIKWGWSLHDRVLDPGVDSLAMTLATSNSPIDAIMGLTNFTATLTGPLVVPEGKISFVDVTKQKVLGRADIVSAGGNKWKATLENVSFDAGGAHTIRAVFDGDAHWEGNSATVQQQVNKVEAQLNLTASANPFVGLPITLTATVSGVSVGAPTPTGVVAFYDGQTLLGTAVLNASGQATHTVTLSAGWHNLTAHYAGSDVFNTTLGSLALLVEDLET